jgi:hypothetical protein
MKRPVIEYGCTQAKHHILGGNNMSTRSEIENTVRAHLVRNYGISKNSPLLHPLTFALLDCLREVIRVKQEYSPVRLSYANACCYRYKGLCIAALWTEENGDTLYDRLCALGNAVNAQIREIGIQQGRYDLL